MDAKLHADDPAFPRPDKTPGVSTRTYLAGLAMQGILACPGSPSSSVAEEAVRQADALITALNNNAA